MPQKTPPLAAPRPGLHAIPIARAHRLTPARAAALAKIGITTLWDVLHEVPRPAPPPPPWCEDGDLPKAAAVRLRARLVQVQPSFRRGRAPGVVCVLERHDARRLRAHFFHATWLRRLLLAGEWFIWEGRMDDAGGTLLHPRFTHLPQGSAQERPAEGGLRMQYRTLEHMTPLAWTTLTDAVLAEDLASAADPLGELAPADYQALLASAHRPGGLDEWQAAIRQLAVRELTAMAWRLQALTAQGTAAGWSWACEPALEQRARARLPWPLTPAQETAWSEIRTDLRSPAPMSRLLQGEVGSGKTAVAVLACLMVAGEGGQSLVLAPTAILAHQHREVVGGWLAGSRLQVGLLTGATSPAERSRLLAALADGTLHILIGTHALLTGELRARRLGLVVIDEQHRFGVAQRMAALGQDAGGPRPDLLLLSATPIPRTLALTLYGDLPVSRMQGRPPGRPGTTTAAVRIAGAAVVRALVQEELERDGRVFVILARRRDHAEGLDAVHLHQELLAHAPTRSAALLHGELDDPAKAEALARFADGRARVLVATSVVEVGIDMPEATLLLVVEAERFGLAQLHQLRGRVGRGERAGRCLLGHAGADLPERLRILLRSDDGLAIAEADLQERGPGDLLGLLQAGAVDLRFADLARDLDALQQAHARVRAWRAAGRTCPAPLAALARAGSADPAAG